MIALENPHTRSAPSFPTITGTRSAKPAPPLHELEGAVQQRAARLDHPPRVPAVDRVLEEVEPERRLVARERPQLADGEVAGELEVRGRAVELEHAGRDAVELAIGRAHGDHRAERRG